jgi:hypothetical protein
MLEQLRAAGEKGLLERLERAGRQKHNAAVKDAYTAYTHEIEKALDDARSLGLEGPDLLDHFYLMHRLAYRSVLGARSGRYSTCATPGFVRASFDLTPEERLENRLHEPIVAKLVPEWADVLFCKSKDGGPLPEIYRARMWEKPGHAETVEELINTGTAWPTSSAATPSSACGNRPAAARATSTGKPSSPRRVGGESFEAHLRELSRAASAEATIPAGP